MKNSKLLQKALKAYNERDLNTLDAIIRNQEFEDKQNMDSDARDKMDFEENNTCRDMFYLGNPYGNVVEILEDSNIDYEPENMQDYFSDELLTFSIY